MLTYKTRVPDQPLTTETIEYRSDDVTKIYFFEIMGYDVKFL